MAYLGLDPLSLFFKQPKVLNERLSCSLTIDTFHALHQASISSLKTKLTSW